MNIKLYIVVKGGAGTLCVWEYQILPGGNLFWQKQVEISPLCLIKGNCIFLIGMVLLSRVVSMKPSLGQRWSHSWSECPADLYSLQVADKDLFRMLCRELGLGHSVLHKYYLSPQSHKNHDFSVFRCVKRRKEGLEQRNLLQLLSRRSPKEGAKVISQETRLQVLDWWVINLCLNFVI